MLKRWVGGGCGIIADSVSPSFSRNRHRTPSNTRSCLPVNPLAPFVRLRLPEPGKPGHKLRGSWPSPPPRCRGPPSLRWRPRRSTFAPGRGQTPLATPRPYSTPGSPSPRPLPAGPAQPLAPRRPALLLGPEPSKCPELAPRPHAQASPAGPGFPLPPRPAPESTSYFATQLGPIRVRPAPRPPESPVRSGVRPPTPPLPGCRPGPLPAPAEPTQARGPGPGPGAGLGPGGVAASRHEGWLGPRKIRTRAGWGPRKASFFIFSPPPPQGRAVPPLPCSHGAPFTWAEPLGRCRNFALLHAAGEAGEAGGGGRWRGVLGSGRWAPGGHVGEEGKEEEEGGAGLQFSGLPLPAPGKPEPRRAAADPALATGEERSHLPRPARGSRKEGGRATPLGVGEQAFSLELYVRLSLSPFSLCVCGGVGSCLRGGRPHRTPRPSPPPAPHFPNPGDLGAWLRHGHRGRPRVQPQPRRRSGTGAGEGKMPGLAASPRVSGAAHLSWQRPGLQPPWAELKGQPPAWAWRHLGGGGG